MAELLEPIIGVVRKVPGLELGDSCADLPAILHYYRKDGMHPTPLIVDLEGGLSSPVSDFRFWV